MAARLATVAALLLCAAVLAVLGHWGRAHGASLAPAYLAEDDRERRAAVVRRGGLACYLGAAAMAAVAVLAVL